MNTTTTPAPEIEALRGALRTVIDPEVGVNIVDLGLVYEIEVDGRQVRIIMTLSSPACPMGDMIREDIHAALRAVLPPGFESVIDVVWEPAWGPHMMSAAARIQFGW
ncbi:MAG: metal-sulfur cluster assembly factor [Proteobacteria bacterium]|nr:metal-sulfur cluster assembly factor [Pseudomonadota bacterium]HQR04089.1 metal-sulfur cluster assembly factor [Rhodocyclaceae bacterium]